ncbi:MAG: hypothetical protein WKF31_03535 [Thermoleophilaceae bacterium]
MRTLVVLATCALFAALFALAAPEGGWSHMEASLGALVIMLVVGGIGWHTNLFARRAPTQRR